MSNTVRWLGTKAEIGNGSTPLYHLQELAGTTGPVIPFDRCHLRERVIMDRVVDLLRIFFQRGQGFRPFAMVVRAVGRRSEFRELLCGNKVRYLSMTQARPRTIRHAFVPLDVRKALIHSGNQLLTFCCQAIEDGELGRKITQMSEDHG
jgi:hypothetical protein